MKRVLRWTAIVIAVVAVTGFLAFLYFVPPFTLQSPESFIEPEAKAPPSLDHIADSATRALAERGKYIVVRTGCTGCHQVPGPQGPQWDFYLAGGFKIVTKAHGVTISRNLTPDRETGIGSRTDEELLRALRNGVFHDGRAIDSRAMVWPVFSHLSDEDAYAVVVFLRQLPAVRHPIPDPSPTVPSFEDEEASEINYGGLDYGSAGPTK